MFIDKATIKVKAGDGGNGVVSFLRTNKNPNGGPDGGDGGKGGSVIFIARSGLNTLIEFKYRSTYRAENGIKGDKKNKTGKDGKDIVIEVPQGTLIRDTATGTLLADMFECDTPVVLLRGGRGGKGNSKFVNSVRQAPRFSQSGEKTKEFLFELELKTIADVGLVGYPSVGKSTLLKALTNANPKIASYHFTTLSPNLGVATQYDKTFVIADIPGLIDGASEGVGLGHQFLRHIERVRLIVHLVDISGSEERDPYTDYVAINAELAKYSEKLAKLPQIIALSKVDLLEEPEKTIKQFTKKLPKNSIVVPISAISYVGLDELKQQMYQIIKDLPEIMPQQTELVQIDERDVHSYQIVKKAENYYEVVGGFVDHLIRGVVLSDPLSFAYFQKKVKDNGILEKLRENGAQNGDIIKISDIEFELMD